MPRQVPAVQTCDWSRFATLPLYDSCWLLGPGSCSPHSIRRSPSWRHARSPDQSRLTVNLPLGSNFGPRYVRAVLAAGERAHVDRLGDLEAVIRGAVDDLGGVRRAFGPIQAVAALGVVERVVGPRAERRAGGEADRPVLAGGSGQRGEQTCD